MTPSPTITLFNERIDTSRQPATFLASILIHFGVISLLWFGIAYTPRVDMGSQKERYTVRRLDLRTPEQQTRRSTKGSVRYPAPQLASSQSAPGKLNARPPVMRQIAHARLGPQTLIQPDLPNRLTLIQPVPVPLVLLWSPSKTPVKEIVAPLPEKSTASDVRPSLDRPNEEVNLADVDLSATNLPSVKLPLMASTSSPVVVHRPELTQLPTQTVSPNSAPPAPATVMSLSDLQMKDGTITLPPVNETARSAAPGELAPGEARDSATPDKNDVARKAGGTGAAQSAANAIAPLAPAAASVLNAASPAGQPKSADSPSASGSDAGNGQSNQTAATAITLPRNGRFGAVVVGDALEDQFPEMAGVWNGRMAYTVYLHVGLARSWILQYSLPRSADADAAGITTHLEAPWPYNIVRPNLDPGAIDADALMVHGFVNQSGRFETLSIVFPQSFPQAQFVLSSLQQWQFRPAVRDGHGAMVEVLLIIPEELN